MQVPKSGPSRYGTRDTLSLGGGLSLFANAPNVPVATVGVVGLGIGVMGPLFRSLLGVIALQENRGVIMTLNESFITILFTLIPVAISVFAGSLVDAIRSC